MYSDLYLPAKISLLISALDLVLTNKTLVNLEIGTFRSLSSLFNAVLISQGINLETQSIFGLQIRSLYLDVDVLYPLVERVELLSDKVVLTDAHVLLLTQ